MTVRSNDPATAKVAARPRLCSTCTNNHPDRTHNCVMCAGPTAKLTRYVASKPRIRKIYEGGWNCTHRGTSIVGIGPTPELAYSNWEDGVKCHSISRPYGY